MIGLINKFRGWWWGFKFGRNMAFIYKEGSVRDIKEIAQVIQEWADNVKNPELKELGENLERDAENIVLKRVLR